MTTLFDLVRNSQEMTEDEVRAVSSYIAKLTLQCVGSLFTGATVRHPLSLSDSLATSITRSLPHSLACSLTQSIDHSLSIALAQIGARTVSI